MMTMIRYYRSMDVISTSCGLLLSYRVIIQQDQLMRVNFKNGNVDFQGKLEEGERFWGNAGNIK
jgi:hypothetical protein